MLRGIPNKKKSTRRHNALVNSESAEKLKAYLGDPCPPDPPTFINTPSVTIGGAATPAQSPVRRERHFATITHRKGSMAGSVIEKIREDMEELGIKAIFIEYSGLNESSIPTIIIHSIY